MVRNIIGTAVIGSNSRNPFSPQPGRAIGIYLKSFKWYSVVLEGFSAASFSKFSNTTQTAFSPEKGHKKTLLRLLSRGLIFGTPILRRRRLWRIKRDLTSRSDVREHRRHSREAQGNPTWFAKRRMPLLHILSKRSKYKIPHRVDKRKEQKLAFLLFNIWYTQRDLNP